MFFHRNLNDYKSPQVSRTCHGILGVLNNAVIWMVSILPLISNSSSPFSEPLRTVQSAPTTIGIIVTLCFFSQARSKYLSFSSSFFDFHSVVRRKQQNPPDYFFFLIRTRSGLLAGIKWSVCISKSQKFYESHFQGWILVCAYTIW